MGGGGRRERGCLDLQLPRRPEAPARHVTRREPPGVPRARSGKVYGPDLGHGWRERRKAGAPKAGAGFSTTPVCGLQQAPFPPSTSVSPVRNGDKESTPSEGGCQDSVKCSVQGRAHGSARCLGVAIVFHPGPSLSYGLTQVPLKRQFAAKSSWSQGQPVCIEAVISKGPALQPINCVICLRTAVSPSSKG